MSQSEDIGKLTNSWPILLDHFIMRFIIILLALLYSSVLISPVQNKSMDPYIDIANYITSSLDSVVLENNREMLDNKLEGLRLKYKKINTIRIYVQSGGYFKPYLSKSYDENNIHYKNESFRGSTKVNVAYFEDFILIDTPHQNKVHYNITFDW